MGAVQHPRLRAGDASHEREAEQWFHKFSKHTRLLYLRPNPSIFSLGGGQDPRLTSYGSFIIYLGNPNC